MYDKHLYRLAYIQFYKKGNVNEHSLRLLFPVVIKTGIHLSLSATPEDP